LSIRHFGERKSFGSISGSLSQCSSVPSSSMYFSSTHSIRFGTQPPHPPFLHLNLVPSISPILTFFYHLRFYFVVTNSRSILLGATIAQIFLFPPYNFSPSGVGNTNIASLIGGILGFFASGPVLDWCAKKGSEWNKGTNYVCSGS